MDNKIIAAAREAGFRTGNITLSGEGLAPIPFIAPLSATNCQHEVSRLYAIAYRQGLEDAAKECELNSQRWPDPRKVYVAHECAAAIRTLMQEQNHG